MKRDNHYEAAFEAYLRDKGVGFLAVDEAKRSLLGGDSIKSLDFVVVGPDTSKLVVDVKGRKFPGGSAEKPGRKVWQNWSTREDVEGVARWAGIFGPEFRGILAFVYHMLPSVSLPEGTPDLFVFREQNYLMRGIEVSEYRERMKTRSEKWGTVDLSVENFRESIRPFSRFLDVARETREKRPASTLDLKACFDQAFADAAVHVPIPD